jgi:type VI secretion system protein ImpM
MLDSVSQHLNRRWLATPLSIWGKLPSHGDFLRHRASAAQARDWQDWVGRIWSQRPDTRFTSRPRSNMRGEPAWVSLEPRRAATDLAEVPVAFVLQPGAMPFSPKHCVQGVMVASKDQVGRPCPLIIFQQITPAWLRRSWTGPTPQRQHDLLYWLARIAARTHASDKSWDELTRTVDAVWQVHAPNWKHLMGAPIPAPSSLQLDTLLRKYCDHDTSDTARGLHGVHRMPWVNWPVQIVRFENPVHAFWQQDIRGGYVNAGESLPALWGART